MVAKIQARVLGQREEVHAASRDVLAERAGGEQEGGVFWGREGEVGEERGVDDVYLAEVGA